MLHCKTSESANLTLHQEGSARLLLIPERLPSQKYFSQAAEGGILQKDVGRSPSSLLLCGNPSQMAWLLRAALSREQHCPVSGRSNGEWRAAVQNVVLALVKSFRARFLQQLLHLLSSFVHSYPKPLKHCPCGGCVLPMRAQPQLPATQIHEFIFLAQRTPESYNIIKTCEKIWCDVLSRSLCHPHSDS